MKNIDIHGMTNMELIRGGIAEWYWATDYIHGDLYEAEELFRQGHLVRSNRLYLIHYPDGMIYEPVHSADGQYLGTPVYDGSSVVLLVVSFTESVIRIMRFLHQQVEVQEVARLPLSAVKDCYNLMLHTSPLSLTRQPNDGTFEIIWPEHVRFAINDLVCSIQFECQHIITIQCCFLNRLYENDFQYRLHGKFSHLRQTYTRRHFVSRVITCNTIHLHASAYLRHAVPFCLPGSSIGIFW